MRSSSGVLWRGAARVLAGVVVVAVARVAARPGAQITDGFATYDYSEQDEGVEKTVRLAVSDDLETVRGLLVNTNAAGGDTRERYTLAHLRALAALHGLAFVDAKGLNSHPGSVTILEHALSQLADQSGHPELLNAPSMAYGFSAGAGFANRLVDKLPERVIASAPLSTVIWRMVVPDPLLEVPVCMFSGEQEEMNLLLVDAMQTHRPRGAAGAGDRQRHGGSVRGLHPSSRLGGPA